MTGATDASSRVAVYIFVLGIVCIVLVVVAGMIWSTVQRMTYVRIEATTEDQGEPVFRVQRFLLGKRFSTRSVKLTQYNEVITSHPSGGGSWGALVLFLVVIVSLLIFLFSSAFSAYEKNGVWAGVLVLAAWVAYCVVGKGIDHGIESSDKRSAMWWICLILTVCPLCPLFLPVVVMFRSLRGLVGSDNLIVAFEPTTDKVRRDQVQVSGLEHSRLT